MAALSPGCRDLGLLVVPGPVGPPHSGSVCSAPIALLTLAGLWASKAAGRHLRFLPQTALWCGSLLRVWGAGCRSVHLGRFMWRGRGARDRVSLCDPGCSGTCFVHQAGLDLRDPPSSVSPLLD